MSKFIIQILHSAKCFRKGSFFQRTLSWNLTQSKNGNFVDGYKKNLVLVHDNNSDVEYIGAKLGVKTEIFKSQTPDILMAYWDGDKHEQLGTMAAPDAPAIAEKIQQARSTGIEVISRYPNFTFRAQQKIAILTNEGKRPTVEKALAYAIEEDDKAEELRNQLAFRDEQPAVDPDTGLPYSAEAKDAKYNIINAHEFNSNLWRGIWEEMKRATA